jgi:hypothetical protein
MNEALVRVTNSTLVRRPYFARSELFAFSYHYVNNP